MMGWRCPFKLGDGSLNPDLRNRLEQSRQGETLKRWEGLSEGDKKGLENQLLGIDFAQAFGLFLGQGNAAGAPPLNALKAPTIQTGPAQEKFLNMGVKALRTGEVAVMVVAGGQATRLGTTKPKGIWPITPVRNHSLFHLHAEKVLALSQRHGKAIPLLIMTSPSTHDESLAHFEENHFFGLAPGQARFFQQGIMPAMDLNTGQLLFEQPHRVFTAPDGHGGSLAALKASGLAQELWRQGIRHLFYFQVDNPLVRIADPVFLGQHLDANAEISCKVIEKTSPGEKIGIFAEVAGKCHLIEYSDLPGDLAEKRTPDGKLLVRAGNPAIHLFNLEFLLQILEQGSALPFHVARKKVSHVNLQGEWIVPQSENALKFERFIFDLFLSASRWLLVETAREEEFAPLKNAEGEDSPETARAAQNRLFHTWLTRAGAKVANFDPSRGSPDLEICPFFALDEKELADHLPKGISLTAPALIDKKTVR